MPQRRARPGFGDPPGLGVRGGGASRDGGYRRVRFLGCLGRSEQVVSAGQQLAGDRNGRDLLPASLRDRGVSDGELRGPLGSLRGLAGSHRCCAEPCPGMCPCRTVRSEPRTAGVSPAQLASLRAFGNRVMSPISASMTSAVNWPTPGSVVSIPARGPTFACRRSSPSIRSICGARAPVNARQSVTISRETGGRPSPASQRGRARFGSWRCGHTRGRRPPRGSGCAAECRAGPGWPGAAAAPGAAAPAAGRSTPQAADTATARGRKKRAKTDRADGQRRTMPRRRCRSAPSWPPCPRPPGAAGTSRSPSGTPRHQAAFAVGDEVSGQSSFFLSSCGSAKAHASAPERSRRSEKLRESASRAMRIPLLLRFAQVRGLADAPRSSGQGRGRTADLPLFRGSVATYTRIS